MSLGYRLLALVLGAQVRALVKRHRPFFVGVAGSIGKTSTKIAIAQLLSAKYRVCFQENNRNGFLTTPFVFYDLQVPGPWDVVGWTNALVGNFFRYRRAYPYVCVVVELGTDNPGYLARFKQYLELDVGVLSAITNEHMEAFESLENIAKEETVLGSFSKRLIVNGDLCEAKYLESLNREYETYGLEGAADHTLYDVRMDHPDKCEFAVSPTRNKVRLTTGIACKQRLYSICAAVAVGRLASMSEQEIEAGLQRIGQVSGRLQKLAGVLGSTLIDDTYNAGPKSMQLAIDVLCRFDAPQRVAVLGSMNELGAISAEEHRRIGLYCKPNKIDLVVVVGKEAQEHLAPAAREVGCRVVDAANAEEAGRIAREHLVPNAVVLFKASGRRLYLEEAVKELLANPADQSKLVRQDARWMRKKAKERL